MQLETLRISKHVSLISPWPAILLENEDTLVLSDIHLGMEDQREAEGIHIPRSVYPDIVHAIVEPIRLTGVSKVALLGDVKHEFGRPAYTEWAGARKLFETLLKMKVAVNIVRGNHDNYIIYILKELGLPLHEPYLQLGRYTLFHGHLDSKQLPMDVEHVVIGHEHPAISVSDDLGVKHRYKAFLSGKWKGAELTVLPSVSPLATGSDVNELPQHELLSPLLREVEIDDFTPYLIDIGEAVERFPKVGSLRMHSLGKNGRG